MNEVVASRWTVGIGVTRGIGSGVWHDGVMVFEYGVDDEVRGGRGQERERLTATGLLVRWSGLPCFILTRRQIGVYDLAKFGEEVALDIA